MDFQITILGSGAALPTERRQCSAQLVQLANTFLLIDCGENTQIALRKQKVKLIRLQYIFISHLHGDHFLGLPGLLFTLHLLGRSEPVTIFSPKGLKEIIEQLLSVSGSTLKYPLRFIELSGNAPASILKTKNLEVTQIPLHHTVETFGFLIQEKHPLLKLSKPAIEKYAFSIEEMQKIKRGEDYITSSGECIPNAELTLLPKKSRSYAYCADTAFIPKIVPIIKEVNVLYHEATFAKAESLIAEQKLHTTSEQAAQMAKEAHAGLLIIGHISARYKEASLLLEEAKAVFPHTILAEDGSKITL